jgi:sulfopyruvate decarboxylase alpha subunit
MTAGNIEVASEGWSDLVHELFQEHGIEVVSFVPDAGLARLIERCQSDSAMRAVTLTTEEEGIALGVGVFLGGKRAALLMQSSGVGNCINMLSLPRLCNAPLFMLITMRGEWGEFNPWQVPMGHSTPRVLETSGVAIYRVDHANDIGPTVDAAIRIAFASRIRVAVLLSQRLIGTKDFGSQGK